MISAKPMRRQRKPAPTVLPIGARLKGEGEMRRDRSLLLLGTGLVASLARPGGNVIGSTVQAPDLAGKRLGFLREVIPSLRRLAILANAGYPAALRETGEVEAADE